MLDVTSAYLEPVLDWYSAHARDLPWRKADATPWSVLVSEVMLQQTPVSRVLPAHRDWLGRWGSPAALAGDSPGEAVRQWGRLGYPRRALRLHEAATIVTRRHGGRIPAAREELLALPGIGAYTASAVAVFAFGRRHAVLDTNVRRVLARLVAGQQFPVAQPSAAEYRLADSLLPDDAGVAARWSVAVMELGALTCTAAKPRCSECPVAAHCRWLAAGRQATGAKRVGQRYEGTDRQCRGRLLGLVRDSREPVSLPGFDAVWPDNSQRARALDGLVADGLVDPLPDGRFALPALPPLGASDRGSCCRDPILLAVRLNANRGERRPSDPAACWRRRFLILGGGIAVLALLAVQFASARPDSAAANSSIAPALARDNLPPAAYGKAWPGPSPTPRPGAASPAVRVTGTASPRATASRTRTSDTQRPGASASATATARQCAPGGIVLSLFTSQASYRPGERPRFDVYGVSTAPGTCLMAFGAGSVRVIVTSHGQVVWDSAACKPAPAPEILFQTGVPQLLTISWNRAAAAPAGCAGSLPPGASGTFQAVATGAGQHSSARAFTLLG